MKRRIDENWEYYRNKLGFRKVKRPDIVKRIESAEKRCRSKLRLLRPELSCLEEAILFSNCLRDLIWHLQSEAPSKKRGNVMLLTGRICSYLVSIRQLIICGFEDPARALSRTLLETVNLSLAILIDDNLNSEYGAEHPLYDDNKFWRQRVSGRNLDKYLTQVLDSIGRTPKQREKWFAQRKGLWKWFSNSTHTSSISVARSSIVFSIEYPGKISVTTYGYHGIHAPQLALNIANLITDLGGIILKLIMSDSPPSAIDIRSNIHTVEFQTLSVSLFTLQDIMDPKYSKRRNRRRAV